MPSTGRRNSKCETNRAEAARELPRVPLRLRLRAVAEPVKPTKIGSGYSVAVRTSKPERESWKGIGFSVCGSEVVQAELAGDEGGDDEGGGRVEVEVEGQLLVERLHRGGWQRRRRAAARLAEKEKQPREGVLGGLGYKARDNTTRVRSFQIAGLDMCKRAPK